GLREVTDQRRSFGRAAHFGVRGRARLAAAHPHFHRRRVVRPPSCPWRYGARLRAGSHRRLRQGPSDQLWRVLEPLPAAVGSGDLRELVLELRTWHRALALRLRVQFRASWLATEMARTAPEGAGWAARRGTPALCRACRGAGARPLGGAERLHRGAARSPRGDARAFR